LENAFKAQQMERKNAAKKKIKKKKKEGFVFGKRKGEKPVFQSFQLLSC
jgi:hypothetical protein